jgi:hypothetical protein
MAPVLKISELEDNERQLLIKTLGNTPKACLQVKGPQDADWSYLTATSFSDEQSRTQVLNHLNKTQDQWTRQGFFSEHSYRIVDMSG